MIVVQRRRSDGEVQEEQKGIKGEKKVAGAGISAQPGSKGGGWRNLALNQPGARPSPNNQQPGQAPTSCDVGTTIGAATSQHGACRSEKQVLLHISYGFYVVHNYIAATVDTSSFA